jgi:hypothetical protein
VSDGSTQSGLDAYIAAFEALTPDRLDTLRGVCAEGVRFVDPFNDVHGIEAFITVFAHMYETLDEAVFVVTDRATGTEASYIRWTMTARRKGTTKRFKIEGMSEIHFDPSGRATLHVDHWDAAAQLYEHVPLLGWVLRRLRGFLAAPSV